MNLNNLLVFDTDKSLASIGGPDRQESAFGIPPVDITGGLPAMFRALNMLFDKQRVQTSHPLIGHHGSKIQVTKSEKGKSLDGIAVDTLSTLGDQERNRIARNSTLTRQQWGEYGTGVRRLLKFIKHIPIPVIVTTHITLSKDDFTGFQHQVPLIKGSTKDDMGKYFDVVLYAETKQIDGESEYRFLTSHNNTQPAKDRLNCFPDNQYIPQNLAPIVTKYKDYEMPAKILICGKNGTGKTSSLATLTGNGKYESNSEDSRATDE